MPLFDSVMQEKPAVVLDIGAVYTKLGFAAEPFPRFIIPSVITDDASSHAGNEEVSIFKYADDNGLYDNLVAFVQEIFFKYVLVSPKDRRVVIVESVFCPTSIREALARVLFRHFEVASVFFLPSHLVVLTTLATSTALVVDMGYRETVIVPVYSGVQVMHAFQAQPLGAAAVHDAIRRQLTERQVARDLLTEDVVEDIKVRTCFVTSYERAVKYREESSPSSLSITPCPDVPYPVRGKAEILIPGVLRETAFEALFPYDNDRQGLPFIVLDAILACPVDMRRELAANIVLVGGTAMTLGLKHRLQLELEALAASDHYYKDRLFIDAFRFHAPPSKANCTGWVGGSIYGGTDLLLSRSLTRETYARTNRVPDWANLEDNNSRVGG